MRRAPAIDVTVRGAEETVTALLKKIDGVASVKRLDAVADESDVATYRCAWTKKLPDADIAKASEAIVAALVAAGLAVREARAAGGSLEDVFRDLTRGVRDREEEARA
jgi:hypothetical protein